MSETTGMRSSAMSSIANPAKTKLIQTIFPLCRFILLAINRVGSISPQATEMASPALLESPMASKYCRA